MEQVVTSQIMKDLLQIKQGSYSGVSGDILDHTAYDTALFAATTIRATTTFFTSPIGGNGNFGTNTKTKNETNMTDPGKFPAGQGFLIKEFGFKFQPFVLVGDLDFATNVSDITNVLHGSIFEIRISGREFDLQMPGSQWLPAIYGNARQTIVQATDMMTRAGEILSSGWAKLAAAIPVGELVSFSVVQLSGSAVAALATILSAASDRLATQNAQLQLQLRGTLLRSK